MIQEDPKAKQIIQEFEKRRGERATYESAWKDIRQFVRPNTVDFNATSSPGDVRTERMYDSTAMQANADLANEVVADLFSPAERTFGIAVAGDIELNRDPDVIEWTDYVSEVIFAAYSDERSQLTSSVHEVIQDVTAFGNGILLQEWSPDERQIIFQSKPLANCYFGLNKDNLVDSMYRNEDMTVKQIKEMFPEAVWEDSDKDPPEKKYCVIHAVYPRSQSERTGSYKGRMPFASCWVIKEKKKVIDEGGYRSFPYHTPRWNKVSDEVYGRGPAINCLPSIRMLNRMKLTAIRAAQKATDPTVWLPSEGIRLPYKEFPGAVNFYDKSEFPNGFSLQAQEHRGNFPVTLEMMEAERLEIRKAFYTDWLEWFPKTERQTAEEIRELTARKLTKMAPLTGRLQTELSVPMIQRSFELKMAAGEIPEPPSVLQGKLLKVSYVSASARAQAASEANALILYAQQVIPLSQANPEILDAIDWDAYAQELAYKQRISRRILRSPEDIQAIRGQRKQEEQSLQMAGAAEPLSKAALNFAQAQAV